MQHTNIVPAQHFDDTTPNQPQEQAHTEYIHNFSNLDWHTEDEPPPSHQPKLYHLLTIMGLTLIAHYPPEHTLGEHYLAWAELTSEPTLTIH